MKLKRKKAERLAKQREYDKAKKQSETEEKKAERLAKQREYNKAKKQSETEEKKAERLAKRRELVQQTLYQQYHSLVKHQHHKVKVKGHRGGRQELPRKVCNFKRADWLGLSAHLESLRLSVIHHHDIDSAWEACSSAVQSAVDMFVPSRNLKVSTSPPWIDGEVRNLQNKKRTAWKRAKRSDSPSHWEKFRVAEEILLSWCKASHG
ncbi:hypothetical protein Bbelb_018870 [Branchiostoma belcheri]|nr:hypothetical protein Bbelb_018870 [Branchiostoma belcheri]